MLPLMSGTRTRLDPGVRREQILAAAREVFVADDYAHASMEAVARSAGVTTGLVNHYFGTKRDLYLAVVADLAAGLPEMVDTDLPDLALEELIALNWPGSSTPSSATTRFSRCCSAARAASAATPRSRRS